jgi:hypothetical protein
MFGFLAANADPAVIVSATSKTNTATDNFPECFILLPLFQLRFL